MHWISQFIDHVFPIDEAKAKIEDGFSLKYNNLPERIFKYRECDSYSLKNLRQDKIWLAEPTTFNDPYDCHHYANFDLMGRNSIKELIPALRLNLTKEQGDHLETLVNNDVDPKDALAQVVWGTTYASDATKFEAFNSAWQAQNERLASETDTLKTAFRLCSFSERVDSPLMWAHYSKNHKGFCIEYDIKSLRYNDVISRCLFPVIYQDKVFDATEAVMNYGNSGYNEIHTFKAALIKSTDWSYEKEWRLVFTEAQHENPCTFDMPKAKAVYLGSHIKDSDAEKIKDICNKKNIPVFKMKHSRSDFRMTAEKL